MSSRFFRKKVLVAGGTGLIGKPLVEMLLALGATVRVASLDHPSRSHEKAEFVQIDLRYFPNCLEVCRAVDYVFNLLCVKGSPAVTLKKPASFFVTMLQFNTNLMEAARQAGVSGYLFTSSVGVYSPASVFVEDAVWKTYPSEHDKFAGWAKRMGELQAEAYGIEYGWNDIAIVRPANTYGPYDNFDSENAMVIPSLIKRAVSGENPLVVWGDGSQERDFINAKDVARGMILIAQKSPGPKCPVNLASGIPTSVKKVVDVIVNNLDTKPEVRWDTSKPTGDKKRIMDISRARSFGFEPSVSLEDGIKATMEWYRSNRDTTGLRYDIFS